MKMIMSILGILFMVCGFVAMVAEVRHLITDAYTAGSVIATILFTGMAVVIGLILLYLPVGKR